MQDLTPFTTQGDAEGAQTYRGAVQAIRLSEYADRLHEAGLNTAAINSYNDKPSSPQ